jgi:guanyl-specific ribonuclease Sa
VKDVAAEVEGKWNTLEPLTSGTLESATDAIKTAGKKLDAEAVSTTPLPKEATKAVNGANEALKAFGDFGF